MRLELPTLRSARLTLRPCSPSDCEAFIALEQDADVMRFLNGSVPVDPRTRDQDLPFLMPKGTEDYVWTARRTDTESFVGWFCLWPVSDKEAELGYRLRRQDWGQGLASEGASALVAWGFEHCGYRTITACTMTVNVASRRVLEKAGFHHTCTVQVDWAGAIPGGDQGEVQYEVSRAAWAARQEELTG